MSLRRLLVLAVTAVLVPLVLVAAVPAQASTTKDLTLSLTSSAEPSSGDKVSFEGSAPTSLAGSVVTLQRRVGTKGDWISVGKSRVGSDGAFAVGGVSTGVGVNQWRATVKKGQAKHQSRVVKTTVFGWYYLSALSSVDTSDWDVDHEPTTIGGQTFNKSLRVYGEYRGDSSWIDYNVSYRCKTFEASIGVDDQSETGFTGSFTAYLDGAETTFGSKALGPATKVSLDTSARLRLRLEATTTSNNPEGYLGWGDARVLCSGKP
jgi:hypothetical protein